MKCVVFVVALFSFVKCKNTPQNSSAVLISKYAKVTHWGSNSTEDLKEEGRKSKDSPFWNHRLDPKSFEGSNTKKKNPSIAYQYPVYQQHAAKIDKKVEHIPGIGEVVIQDRFEARPLFAYRNKQVSATYGPPPAPKNNLPTSSSPVAFATPPPQSPPPQPSSVFNNPMTPQVLPSRGSMDLYKSPYSSYNPPDFKPDSSYALYPPNAPLSSDDGNASPPSDSAPSTEISMSSLGPPLASYGSDDHSDQEQGHPPDYGPHDYPDHAGEDPMAMYKHHDGPPRFPPKNEEDIYYPPDFPKDQMPEKGTIKDSMMPESMMPQNLMTDSGKMHGDTMDLAPPPASHDYDHSFPQYLYDQHHYDHHVYEEIPHTTMAPTKEDKRVSSTHYSYYYLGRKLWYIPLYFSIYFIIYVTVLILKSIARHKVNLKYTWYEHDTSKQARMLDLNEVRNMEIDHVRRNVSLGLRNSTEKYSSITAM